MKIYGVAFERIMNMEEYCLLDKQVSDGIKLKTYCVLNTQVDEQHLSCVDQADNVAQAAVEGNLQALGRGPSAASSSHASTTYYPSDHTVSGVKYFQF